MKKKIKNNIYIVNKKKFENLAKKFKKSELNNLYVLSDFDSTLTYGTINGKKTPSMIAILRENDRYLDKDYSLKASLLYKKYFPIQNNHKIKKEEKKRLIEEWYIKHFKLLINKKLNKKYFKKIINSPEIKLRDKASEVFAFLNKHKIPLIIISASGLGDEPILMFLKNKKKLYPNINIISNSFVWDKKGNAINYKKPIIHSSNKDEVLADNFSIIKNRKNILLLGDTLDDVKMAENLKYNNLIKICFLNKGTDKYIEKYKKFYDVLILNDSSMEFVNNFLKTLQK